MQSITVELNRFGDPEGILKLSEEYLRANGNSPIVEASIGLKQKQFQLKMKKLGYENFRTGPIEDVREKAETVVDELIEPISKLLGISDSDNGQLRQIDVVTNALELAQLPFEVLEERDPNIVLTRRVRQPWPRKPVVIETSPKILFIWAEPFKKNSTTKRQTVPHEESLELLKKVVADWFESKNHEKTLVEIPNATFEQVKTALQDSKHGFTHIYILAHGRYDDDNERVDLLLEDDQGQSSFHSAEDLKLIFQDSSIPRPGTIIMATCQSGDIDPLEAGGTLGQVLHESGVPIVLASQLELTKTGSSELINTFLASTVNGEDPRLALRACRDALRQRQDETYYDRIALVGYIHLDEDFEEKLPILKLDIALARLEAASKAAVKAATPEETQKRFKDIRTELEKLNQLGNVKEEKLEELLGLKASSLKREAESAWSASVEIVQPEQKDEYAELSRIALRDARTAYAEAAALSRDHHWTGVQSLVLDAVFDGSLIDRKWDWIAACQAARDAANQAPKQLDRFWGLGSILELHIIAPLVDEADLMNNLEGDPQFVNFLEIAKVEEKWALEVVLRQLDRYLEWWGTDTVYNLPEQILKRAQEVRDAIVAPFT